MFAYYMKYLQSSAWVSGLVFLQEISFLIHVGLIQDPSAKTLFREVQPSGYHTTLAYAA